MTTTSFFLLAGMVFLAPHFTHREANAIALVLCVIAIGFAVLE